MPTVPAGNHYYAAGPGVCIFDDSRLWVWKIDMKMQKYYSTLKIWVGMTRLRKKPVEVSVRRNWRQYLVIVILRIKRVSSTFILLLNGYLHFSFILQQNGKSDEGSANHLTKPFLYCYSFSLSLSIIEKKAPILMFTALSRN